MPVLRIALAQVNPTLGDFAANVDKIVAMMKRAKDAGADIVTFPELAVCGYPPEDLLLRPRFLQDCRDALDEAAKQTEGVTAVIGFAEASDGKVFNSAAVVQDTAVAGVYRKIELPSYGVFDEKRYFTPGSGALVLELNGVRVLVTICEDVWIEGGAVEKLAVENGAKVALNISASPFHAGKLDLRREILEGFARRTGTTVCHNNLVGGQDELVFDGGSLIVNPEGKVLAGAKRFEEDFLVADVEVEGGSEPSKESGSVVVLKPRRDPAAERVSPGLAPQLGRVEEIYRALVLGTRDYVRKNGFSQVVIGLSGGIDSSLTAVVAVDALGADNVVGVTMPSQHTSGETRSYATLLANNLDMRLIIVPIWSIFSAYLYALRDIFGKYEPGIEYENLQARIRGNILMALSNKFGWLVLTTGNKSEMATGYCTLYGDMAGGFAVIKDVPKMMVYELSEYANEKAGWEVIPVGILKRAPTAELRRDQKDEDTLPPYAVLDPILKAYVEENKAPDEIAAEGFDMEMVREVVRMVDRSEYKRRQAPPGVKITPKAFGRDRRLPITNRYGINAVRKRQ